MKKSVFALVMALVLLCSSALANEAAFSYTVEEYIAGFTQLCMDSQQRKVVWSDPIDTEGGFTSVVGFAEGMANVYIFTSRGGSACYGMGTEMTISLTETEQNAYDMSKPFGRTTALIIYTSRYMELDNDITALSYERQEIEDACMALVQNVSSSDAFNTAIADGSYSEVAEIAGHTAQLTLVMDMESMAMTFTFVFVP